MGYLDFYRDMGITMKHGANAFIKETNKVANKVAPSIFPNNNPSTRGKQMKTHK